MYYIIANRSTDWVTYNHKRLASMDGTPSSRTLTKWNSVIVPTTTIPDSDTLERLMDRRKVDVFQLNKMVSFPLRFNTRVLLPLTKEDIFPSIPDTPPVPEPEVVGDLPAAEFLVAGGTTYRHGTGIGAEFASSVTDGRITLAVSPLQAFVTAIEPVDGEYASTDDVDLSFLFGVSSTYPLAKVLAQYEITAELSNVDGVLETFTVEAGKITTSGGGVLTGTTVLPNTIQNVTRPSLFLPAEIVEAGTYTLELTATHISSSVVTSVSAVCVVTEAVEVAGRMADPDPEPEIEALVVPTETIESVDWEAELVETTSISRLRELGALFDPPVTGQSKTALISGIQERLTA